jgi:hypothetical protein
MTALDAQPQLRKNDPQAEPWGQQGVLAHLSPAIAKVCILFAFIACLLWHRSTTNREGFAFEPPGRYVELTSIIGRVKLVVAPRPDNTRGGSEFISRPVPVMTSDPWEPGWQKELGFLVTSEAIGPGQPATVVRLRWRTITAVLLLFPVVYYVRAWQRRRAEAELA